MVRAAKLIRQDLFNNENEFEFTRLCCWSFHALLTYQLVKFNAIKGKREESVLHVRHRNSQETPLNVYTGLYIYSKTCKKVRWISFYHLDFVYHLIVSTKFNQLSRKTHANNIVLKKQCARTHYLKICLPQQLLIILIIMRHPAQYLVLLMERAS